MIAATATPRIQLSPSALNELQRLTRDRSDHLIQLTVLTGECAQFAYSIASIPNDAVTAENRSRWCLLTFDPVTIAIETSSIERLDGLSLDYSEDLMGGSFRFENPNASRICSCGNSFDA